MAQVIQCDACKALIKNSDALNVIVRNVRDWHPVNPTVGIDICPRCYRKMRHTLNLDKDVKDNAD